VAGLTPPLAPAELTARGAGGTGPVPDRTAAAVKARNAGIGQPGSFT
jgi:hypothetical protein